MRRFVILPALLIGLGVLVRWLVQPPPIDYPQEFRAAVAALDTGDSARLDSALAVLTPNDEFKHHVWMLRGGRHLRHGNYQLAIECLGLSRPIGEVREPLLRYTGETLYRLGRIAESERVLRDLVITHPNDPHTHRWLAAGYYDLGAMESALSHLEVLARLRPDDPLPHRLSGRIYLDFQRYREAAAAWQRCLDRQPDETLAREARVNLALVPCNCASSSRPSRPSPPCRATRKPWLSGPTPSGAWAARTPRGSSRLRPCISTPRIARPCSCSGDSNWNRDNRTRPSRT